MTGGGWALQRAVQRGEHADGLRAGPWGRGRAGGKAFGPDHATAAKRARGMAADWAVSTADETAARRERVQAGWKAAEKGLRRAGWSGFCLAVGTVVESVSAWVASRDVA